MERTSANKAIDSMIIGKDSYRWKHEYIGGGEVPRCDIDRKIVYSPKFGPIMDEEDDILVRGKNIHECAHARLTPRNGEASWGKVKMNIVNAIEDCRIEKAVGEINSVIEKDIRALNVSMNRKINQKFSDEETLKRVPVINEALTALMFSSTGLPIGWNLTEQAQKYFDACKDIFDEYKSVPNYDKPEGFDAIVDIADRVYEKMKELKEEENSDDGNSDSENDSSSDSENSDSENDSSSDGENSDSENDSSSDGENSEGGSSTDGDGEDSKDTESGDEEVEKSEKSSSKEGESKDFDSKKSDSSSKNSGKDNASSVEDSEGKKSTKKDVAKALEEECETGNVLEKELENAVKTIWKESKEDSNNYTAYTDEDVFVVPENEISSFEESRSRISSEIGRLSNYTEEALRAMSRCQKMKNLEKGRIDNKKLCGLSKSLTKKVFYKSKDGIDTNVDVSILIDESGSIGRMKFDLRTLTIAFSEVFNRLGINFEVMGYTTVDFGVRKSGFTRSCPIKMKVYKSFNENYGNARYRLGSIESECHNVDGESVLHAYRRIRKEKGKRKIIFVLSDGIPEAGGDNYKLGEHLKEVVANIRKNHDEIYAFGIGTTAPEKFYGKDYFVYLSTIKELGTSFFKRFKEIVAK